MEFKVYLVLSNCGLIKKTSQSLNSMLLFIISGLIIAQRLYRVYFCRPARGQPASNQCNQSEQRCDGHNGYWISTFHAVELGAHSPLPGSARKILSSQQLHQ